MGEDSERLENNRKICAEHKVKLLQCWKKSGSYTVEAAFIMPVVLGLALVILYITYILHDRAVLQANLDNIIFLLTEEELEEDEYDRYLSHALWITSLEKVKIKNGALTVSGEVSISATVDIPVLSYFMCGKQKGSFSESFYKVQPEEIIRYGADILRKTDE